MTRVSSCSALVAAWRSRARELEPYAPTVATAFSRAAEELERVLQLEAEEVLTLAVAATESGYTTDHLSRLIREGKIPNAGRPHAPRIRRSDLSRKPSARRQGAPVAASDGPRYDPVADARALLGRRGGQ